METERTKNILVTNIDPKVTVEALTTFFSFTGNVISVRLSDAPNGTKTAIITFDNEESVKTAELMSGATLENNRIEIQPTTLNYRTENEEVYSGKTLPQRTIPELPQQHTKTSVAASLLAKGYILASDTFQKAVEFDKQHSITSSILAGVDKVKEKAIEVDEKLHLSEYFALGCAYVNSIITGIDEKYEVSKTVTEVVSTTSKKIDKTLHITEGVEMAMGVVQTGVEYVLNSEAVASLKNQTNNFKEDVKYEINSMRPNVEEMNGQNEMNDEIFEVNEMKEYEVPQNETVTVPLVDENEVPQNETITVSLVDDNEVQNVSIPQ